MSDLDDETFAKKLIDEIAHIKYAIKYYISYTKTLETELEYYKNAYENRVDEFINKDRR